MKGQVTITAEVAKEVIAQGIIKRNDFKIAQTHGKILFKGGTTVDRIAHAVGLPSLRISGRISVNGTKSSGNPASVGAHSVLWEKGQCINIDEQFSEAVLTMAPGDVAIIGANAIDMQGNAGLLLGSPLGGNPGRGLIGLMAQGCTVLIACGLEKMINGSIVDACRAAGIEGTSWSMGMSCGLVPIIGEVITEQNVLEKLFSVQVIPIAAGGVDGAQGSITFIIDGPDAAVQGAIEFILTCRESAQSYSVALLECKKGSPGCAVHKNCIWRQSKGERLTW